AVYLPDSPLALAYSNKNHVLYVSTVAGDIFTISGNKTIGQPIHVIDPSTGLAPISLAVDDARDKLYVLNSLGFTTGSAPASFTGGSLSVIDLNAKKVIVDQSKLGKTPLQVQVDPGSGTPRVSMLGATANSTYSIQKLDPSTYSVAETLNAPQFVWYAFDPTS